MSCSASRAEGGEERDLIFRFRGEKCCSSIRPSTLPRMPPAVLGTVLSERTGAARRLDEFLKIHDASSSPPILERWIPTLRYRLRRRTSLRQRLPRRQIRRSRAELTRCSAFRPLLCPFLPLSPSCVTDELSQTRWIVYPSPPRAYYRFQLVVRHFRRKGQRTTTRRELHYSSYGPRRRRLYRFHCRLSARRMVPPRPSRVNHLTSKSSSLPPHLAQY